MKLILVEYIVISILGSPSHNLYSLVGGLWQTNNFLSVTSAAVEILNQPEDTFLKLTVQVGENRKVNATIVVKISLTGV